MGEKPTLRGLEKTEISLSTKIQKLITAIVLIPICGYSIWWIVQTFKDHGLVVGSIYIILAVVGIILLVSFLGQVLYWLYYAAFIILWPIKHLGKLLIWPFLHVFQSFHGFKKDAKIPEIKWPPKINLFKSSPIITQKDFKLDIGKSTGILLKRKHYTGIAADQKITLNLPECCLNIMTIGGSGAGKTTTVINPLLNQLMAQDTGGLIFDIKGSYKYTVEELAKRNNREIKTIGIGKTPINLLKNLNPETISGFLVSAFYLGGKVNDSFWISAATNLCKSILYVLQQCPGAYTLKALYQFIKLPILRDEFLNTASKNLVNLNLRDRELVITAIQECEAFWEMDGKLKDSVIITIEQVLNSFTHPDISETFCIDHEDAAQLHEVVDGTIFLLDLPLGEWRKTGKTIYTFIKLRFMDIMQSREWTPSMNQQRPVFFCCDEFQDLICGTTEGLSDLDFWSKSRSSKTIGLISSQSLTALIKACHDEETANTILQNFQQKIFFRTTDIEVIEYIEKLAGVAEVERLASGSTQFQISDMSTVDAALFRALGENSAIGFFSIEGRAADDVINLEPLYVD